MPRGKSEDSLKLIAEMKRILKAIQPASVRAVCYQLFIRERIDSMAKNETNKVGVQLSYARKNELIPWEWVVDETREIECGPGWKDKQQFNEQMARSYCREYWTGQPIRVQVWSEKGTVRGTLKPILDKYGIDFFPVHGFNSDTAMHDTIVAAALRIAPLIILYVGDRDCSGLYMVEEDLPNRLLEFWNREPLCIGPFENKITIVHVALTEKDCKNLPSYPAKKTDTRYNWYVTNHGYKAWELDAMSPVILRRRVEQAILKLPIDWDMWERTEKCSKAEQASLENVLTAWEQIQENISMPASK
jgi:hypothetical protein